MSKTKSKTDLEVPPYVGGVLVGVVLLVVIQAIWPDWHPLEFADVWHGRLGRSTPWYQWFPYGLPLLLWGLVAKVSIQGLVVRSLGWEKLAALDPKDILKEGVQSSVKAGLFEELAYRWLIFFSAVPILYAANFACFEFLSHWGLVERDFACVEWLYTKILCPVANFATAGKLGFWLQNDNWLIGAAVVSTSVQFKNGHKYQGFLGMTNSWFLGIYFTWFTLNFGILSAILFHMLYNMVIHSVAAISCAIAQKKVGTYRD